MNKRYDLQRPNNGYKSSAPVITIIPNLQVIPL